MTDLYQYLKTHGAEKEDYFYMPTSELVNNTNWTYNGLKSVVDKFKEFKFDLGIGTNEILGREGIFKLMK